MLLDGIQFNVVGVLTAAGDSSDSDDSAIAPLSAVQGSLTGFGPVNQIAVRATSAGSVSLARLEITAILDARRRITDSGDRDYQVSNPAELLEASSSTAGTFTVLLAAVAGISLLVGGIGVTNICWSRSPSGPARSASARPSARPAGPSSAGSSPRRRC